MRNLTPSRSGVFFVDQTVPTTLARNINRSDNPRNLRLNLREHLSWLTYITRRGSNDRPRANVDLLTLLNRAPHVVLADKVDCLCTIVRWWRRLLSWRWR